MSQFQPIPKNLTENLKKITPRKEGYLIYYPVKVTLKNNEVIDRVYIVEQNSYYKKWGIYPNEDKHKKEIKI